MSYTKEMVVSNTLSFGRCDFQVGDRTCSHEGISVWVRSDRTYLRGPTTTEVLVHRCLPHAAYSEARLHGLLQPVIGTTRPIDLSTP